MIEVILGLVALFICVEIVVSHYKYTEILQKLNLEEAIKPPNGWIYRLVHPFVKAARGITHN